MEEIWKTVPSLKGNYEASNIGRIRRSAPGCGTRPGLIMKTQVQRGYHCLCVSMDKKQFTRQVHRLVAEAFLGEIPGDMQVNHKNGIKHDNRIENLEYCTPAQNTRHAYEVLKLPYPKPPASKGEANGRAKLNDACCVAIFKLRKEGWSQQRIADLFSVDQTNISRVLLGKSGFTV